MNAAICKTTDNSTGAMPDKTKKIIVPNFTTFNSYFFDRKHGNMKRQIYNYLNHALESGEFSRLTGFEIGVPASYYIQTCLNGYDYFGFDTELIFQAIDKSLNALKKKNKGAKRI